MINVICLPYAGGNSKIIYREWNSIISPGMNVIPVQLPGHGERINEKPCISCEKAVADIVTSVSDIIDKDPYLVFGHSMGGLLTYLLCARIESSGKRMPEHIFISGRKAPNRIKHDRKIFYKLSDEELILELHAMGGIQRELLNNPDFVSCFLPIIRADYHMIETWQPSEQMINCDVTVLNGTADATVTREDVLGWKDYTRGSFTQFDIRGSHFFLNEEQQTICNIISNTITSKGISL